MTNIYIFKFVIVLSLLVSCSRIQAQPVIVSQHCYGGSLLEYPGGAFVSSSGKITIGGASNSNDGQVTGLHPGVCFNGNCGDFWVVNIDSLGSIIWQKCYGGSDDDEGFSIAPSWNNGAVSCGFTSSNDGDVSGSHGSWDAWILCTDSTGNLLWQKCYGGSNDELPYDIITTYDSGYVFCGWTMSNNGDVQSNHGSQDVWVVKIDRLGNIEWSSTYGGSAQDWSVSIVQTYDSGFAFLGTTYSGDGDVTGIHNSPDYWLGKISKNGSLQWQKCYGGSSVDNGYSLKQCPDSGFILTGRTMSNDGDVTFNHDNTHYDIWTVKTDKYGNIEWQKSLGGTSYEVGMSVDISNDSSYIVGAYTLSTDGDIVGFHGGIDYYMAKLSSTGQFEWGKCFGGGGDDNFQKLIKYGDRDWLMVGSTSSNNGDVSGNHGQDDYWLCRVAEGSTDIAKESVEGYLIALPNPFGTTIRLKFNNFGVGDILIINSIGDVILKTKMEGSLSLDLKMLPTGVYFVEFVNEHFRIIKKIIKIG